MYTVTKKDLIGDTENIGHIIISGDAFLWSEWLTKAQILHKYGDYLSEQDLKKLDEKITKRI